jgi:hypothetical protein
MTRNASEAANGAGDISRNIDGVTKTAEDTLKRAQESQQAAHDLAAIATELSTLMSLFKIERHDQQIDSAPPRVYIDGTVETQISSSMAGTEASYTEKSSVKPRAAGQGA